MNETEKFIEEFKETQNHIYDRGYWAGRLKPYFYTSTKFQKFLYIYFAIIVAILLISLL